MRHVDGTGLASPPADRGPADAGPGRSPSSRRSRSPGRWARTARPSARVSRAPRATSPRSTSPPAARSRAPISTSSAASGTRCLTGTSRARLRIADQRRGRRVRRAPPWRGPGTRRYAHSIPVRVVFRCEFCDAVPDDATQRSLEGQLREWVCGEYLDALPGRWLVWHGHGPFGRNRCACAEHRGELTAAIRETYGTLSSRPWKRPPYPTTLRTDDTDRALGLARSVGSLGSRYG
jgi:hypothetical protein